MIFVETKLKGAFILEPERVADERGFFARTFCQKEFQAKGLQTDFVQCSVSFNAKKGTLRGMHFQAEPFAETKIVRCTMGAAYDVIVDLRPDSETFKQWIAVEITAENGRSIYIPEGFAHGFQTLIDRTELFYQISEFYHGDSVRGVRWNDPAFSIEWPDFENRIINRRDANWTDFIG
jgi:dTDP-4-dehydrorhamnose 3,5-epimerase